MFCLLYNDDGVPYVASYGRYFDHLVKCPDGVWRFREKICELEAKSLPPGAEPVPGGHTYS
jgi:hypothetical protein